MTTTPTGVLPSGTDTSWAGRHGNGEAIQPRRRPYGDPVAPHGRPARRAKRAGWLNPLDIYGEMQFWQGAGGLAGVAEEGDIFGSNLVGSDQQPGGSATNATRSRPGAPPASRLNGR